MDLRECRVLFSAALVETSVHCSTHLLILVFYNCLTFQSLGCFFGGIKSTSAEHWKLPQDACSHLTFPSVAVHANVIMHLMVFQGALTTVQAHIPVRSEL